MRGKKSLGGVYKPLNGQASFKATTREEYFNALVKVKTESPPIGHYKTRYTEIDSKVAVPIYGEKQRWDAHLRANSQQIKEKTFQKTVLKCNRLDKALVYG